MYVYKSVAESRVTNAYHIIHSALTESRSPAGPRRLGTATRMSASLSRRLSAFFGSTPDQDPRTGKVCRSDTRPGDVRERAECAEGSNSAPIRIAPPVSPCEPLCAILLAKASVYPLSPVKANVGQLCQDHFCRVVPIDGSRGWVFVTAFERPLKSV